MSRVEHYTATELRAGLMAGLLDADEVVSILRARAARCEEKGSTFARPSRLLLEELTGERRARPAREPRHHGPEEGDETRYFLTVATDGKARAADWTYPRWALCLSRDGSEPAWRYGNGGPVAVVKPTAAKDAPVWMHRAARYAYSIGGLTAEEAGPVAEWFRTHRVGTPIAEVALAAK